MKILFLIVTLLSTTSHLFGQGQYFFINDSSVDWRNENCWPLTKYFKLTEFNNHEFRIQKTEIIDNHLTLNISYGGGCGKVFLKLFMDTTLDLINESVIQLFPQFIDNDMCKALIHRKVCFDLDFILKGKKKPFLLKIGEIEISIKE